MSADDERFRRGIETHERIGVPFGDPDNVGVIDEHGVRLGPATGELPFFPSSRVVAGQLSRVPFAHPHATPRVTPDAASALARGGRDENARAAGLLHDAPDVAARERCVIDLAIRAARDPVRTCAARSVEYGHRAALRVEATEDPVLAGEP